MSGCPQVKQDPFPSPLGEMHAGVLHAGLVSEHGTGNSKTCCSSLCLFFAIQTGSPEPLSQDSELQCVSHMTEEWVFLTKFGILDPVPMPRVSQLTKGQMAMTLCSVSLELTYGGTIDRNLYSGIRYYPAGGGPMQWFITLLFNFPPFKKTNH